MFNCVFSGTARIVAFLLMLVCTAAAQITGDILVNVQDQSGAGVPGATVTVRSVETGTTRSGMTADDGSFRVAQLATGRYTVRVEKAGFSATTMNASVQTGTTVTLPVSLEVSSTATEVVVDAEATTVNTVNPQLQNTIEAYRITNLPTANQGILQLAGVAPGVIPVTPRNPFLGLGSFNSNGGRGRSNNITLDNATATDVSTTGSAGLGTIPLDGIKEVNLITNQFSAEFGRNGSAQFQILTKSGTNDFHGRLFHFFRNDKLNARDYFDRTGKAAIMRDNQWGAVAGGRIIKDKLFWFGTYEQQKIRGVGGTRIATVPTPAQVSAADPIARQLIQRLQVPTDPSGTVSNPAPLQTDTWAYSGRIDWNITQNDLLFVRGGYQDVATRSPSLTFISSNLPTNGASSISRPANATVSYTKAFSPRLVNNFLASYGRSSPVFAPLFDFGGPAIDFSDGTASFGLWAGLPQGRIQNTFQYFDTLSYTVGRHQLKFGADFNRVQANSFFDSNVRGTLSYVSLAEFLAGRPPLTYTQRFGNSVRGNRVWNHYFFVQDDWKATRDLTLNIGWRYEYAGGPTEVNNILSNLDLNRNEALGAAGTGPFGSFYTGGAYYKDNHNWLGPRFGFAWNPGQGRFVVRGGYGIAYDFIYLNPITNGRFLPPFMYNFALPQTDFTGGNTLAAVLAGTSPFQQTGAATVGNFGTTVRNFGAVTAIDQNLNNPQTQQWSLTFEREMWGGLLARVSYSGTKTNYLQRTRPINFMRPGQFTPPQTLEEQNARQAAGEFSRLNAGLNAPLTGSSNRIDPRFNGVSLVESSANSNYHGLQTFLTKRFSGWYTFTVAYTWSKSIDDVSDALGVLATDTPSQQDPNNNRNNRAVSAFDVPHRLSITHLFAPRARFDNGFARAILDGWEFGGYFQAQSGFPLNIVSGARAGLTDPLLLGGNGQVRPNLVGPLNIRFEADPGGGSRNPNKVTESGLAQPLVGQFGTLGRNVVRINPLIQADWTLGRSFHLTERLQTQFQAQVFNVFNNTTFSRPGNSIAAPATFAYYQDTDTDSRRITLVARFIW